MSRTETHRTFKRRIAQLTRRVRAEAPPNPRQLSAMIIDISNDLRRAGEIDLDDALDVGMMLLEELPEVFDSVEDPLGLLGGAIESVAMLVVDLLLEDADHSAGDLERYGWFHRIFNLWVGDQTGYLQGLDECLLSVLAGADDEHALTEICGLYLRDMALVFPPQGGEKLDSDRNLLLADRYRVEHLLGEVQARHGHYDYLEIVTRNYYRLTGDPVDYVTVLARAGRTGDAIETAREVLRADTAPRPEALKRVYKELARKGADSSASDEVVRQRLDAFLSEPSHATYAALKEAIPQGDHRATIEAALGELQRNGIEADLVFELYLAEDMVLEADGLAVTAPIDPNVLAAGAEAVMEEHTDRAAGWLLIAAHRLMKNARPAAYKKAANWLTTVQKASDATGQAEAFIRVLDDFKKQYGRRKALMRTLSEHGL